MADTLVKAPKAAWEFTPIPDLFRSGGIMTTPELATLGRKAFPPPATRPRAYRRQCQERLGIT